MWTPASLVPGFGPKIPRACLSRGVRAGLAIALALSAASVEASVPLLQLQCFSQLLREHDADPLARLIVDALPPVAALRLRCAEQLLARGQRRIALLDPQRGPGLEFLLFVALTGSRRTAMKTWADTNRPTIPAATRTLYVNSATGSDSYTAVQAQNPATPWATVAKAQANTTAGDTYIFEGTFTGPYLSIAPPTGGNVSAWVTYKASANGATFTGAYCYITNLSYVCLDGLTIDVNRLDVDAGVKLTNSPDCMVRNCLLTNGNGILIWNGSHRAWIEANTFTACGAPPPGNTGEGILIKGSGQDAVVVYNNDVGTCGHMGISCARSDSGNGLTTENSNCRIVLNRINNPWSGGIAVGSASTGTIVEGNDIYNTGRDNAAAGSQMGIQLQGLNAHVRYNRIWHTRTEGLTWFAADGGSINGPCSGNKCYHNTFYDCGNAGQKAVLGIIGRVTDGNSLDFNNNDFDANLVLESGYFVYESQQAFIYIETGSNAYTLSQWVPSGVRTLAGCRFRTNAFYRTVNTGTAKMIEYLTGGTNTWYTPDEAYTAFGAGVTGTTLNAGTIWQVDPLVASVTESNALFLTLSGSSTLKDAAIALSGVAYSGTAPDIGAFEYEASSSSPPPIWRTSLRRSRPVRGGTFPAGTGRR